MHSAQTPDNNKNLENLREEMRNSEQRAKSGDECAVFFFGKNATRIGKKQKILKISLIK